MEKKVIDSGTKIYGLFGYPVRHSLSPAMHNAAFGELRINSVYLCFEVSPKDLKEAVRGIKAMGVCGINVTVPHKVEIMNLLDELDNDAKSIGSINTVKNLDGNLKGYNTDGIGFLKSLKEDLNINPKGKSFFIFGAGGAGRAVAYSLAKEGAKIVYLFDAVKMRAEKLAQDLKERFQNLNTFLVSEVNPSTFEAIDVIINATPQGLKREDPLLFDLNLVSKKTAIYDLVYNPKETRLIKEAKKRGLKAVNGLGMLLYQGAESFKIWTEKEAPIRVMKRALLKALH